MFKTKVYISFVILWKDLFKCFIMPEAGGTAASLNYQGCRIEPYLGSETLVEYSHIVGLIHW